MLNHWQSGGPSHEEPHVPPGFSIVEAIKGVAGRDACLATGATVEVNLKSKLLSRPGWTCGK
jgi:hypothetical protein